MTFIGHQLISISLAVRGQHHLQRVCSDLFLAVIENIIGSSNILSKIFCKDCEVSKLSDILLKCPMQQLIIYNFTVSYNVKKV